RQVRERFGHLVFNSGLSLAAFPFLVRFTTADDWYKSLCMQGMRFPIDCFIRISEMFTAFRVADDDILHTEVFEHCRGHLPRECTAVFEMAVLGTNVELLTFSFCHK